MIYDHVILPKQQSIWWFLWVESCYSDTRSCFQTVQKKLLAQV